MMDYSRKINLFFGGFILGAYGHFIVYCLQSFGKGKIEVTNQFAVNATDGR